MPVLLAGLLSSIGTVLLNMVLKVLAHPKFIEDAFLFLADKIAKQTKNDVDDKLVELAKQILAAKQQPAEAVKPAEPELK